MKRKYSYLQQRQNRDKWGRFSKKPINKIQLVGEFLLAVVFIGTPIYLHNTSDLQFVSPVPDSFVSEVLAKEPTPTPKMILIEEKSGFSNLLTPTPEPKKKYNSNPKVRENVSQFLESTVFPITRQYNIPDALAAGQFAAEGRGNHKYAKAPYNNPFNINAVDSNPDLAFRYATIEDGIRDYAELLKRRYSSAISKIDIDEVVRGVENLHYAGDPKTYRERAKNGYSSYAEFIKDTPEFRYYNK